MKLSFAAGAVAGAAAMATASSLLARRRIKQAELLSDTRAWWRAGDGLLKKGQADVIFLGSGSSVGVPHAQCLLPLSSSIEQPAEHIVDFWQRRPNQSVNTDGRTLHCRACVNARNAISSPSIGPSCYRGNPSMLIRFEDEAGMRRHVMIDCGKTFREGMLRWFPYYGVPGLDALVLTHEHADALLGLDDIRSVQRPLPDQDQASGGMSALALQPLQVFLNEETMDTVHKIFPYLSKPLPPGKVKRFVSVLQWNIVSPYVEFNAAGLRIVPLPVVHGEDYHHMLAFEFGPPEHRFIYMSDVSRIPEKTMEVLKNGTPIETMVLDCLFLGREHPTHVSFEGAMAILADLRPRRAFLVGLSHDFHHQDFQATIEERRRRDPRLADTEVTMAHDGLRVPVDL